MKKLLSLLVTLGLAEFAAAQDHGHLKIGSAGTNQNDQLVFDNGDIFKPSYIKTLIYTNAFQYAGYYHGNITLEVLAATEAHLGPVPNAPALGSWIFGQLVSVDGPPGGAFAFWETGATAPTISLFTGTTGTNVWRVSATGGSPATDPYGHIHGRRFTATKPGIYTVGFRALDFSTNGTGGGPIHRPSDILKIYFQAGINLASVTHTGNVATVTFGGMAGLDFTLQGSTNLTATNWFNLGQVSGADTLQPISDLDATNVIRFYRVSGTPSAGP